GRASKGNVVTKYAIKKIELKEEGVSTLKPRKIWFDDAVQRLNVDGRGDLVGEFRGEDKLLIINQKGIAKTVTPEVTLHFDSDMIVMEKWIPKKPISAIYYDGEKEKYYVKRFLIENEDKEELFISDHENSQLEIVSTDWRPVAEIVFAKERGKDRRDNEEVNIEDFIAVKGISALGNQLTKYKVNQVSLLDPLPYEAPEEIHAEELEVSDEIVVENKLPIDVPEVEQQPKKDFISKEEKAKKALERAIKKKKDNQGGKDQTTLF
ncbi:MAG: DNA gyrase/topoisomerase IV subunit A, partial [Lacinutrix venerupis]